MIESAILQNIRQEHIATIDAWVQEVFQTSAMLIDVSLGIVITMIACLLAYSMFEKSGQAYAKTRGWIKNIILSWFILGLTPSVFVFLWGLAATDSIFSW